MMGNKGCDLDWHVCQEKGWLRFKRTGTYSVVGQKSLEDSGLEAGVNVAAKHSSGDVEATSDLPLRQAVNELRKIVHELPALALVLHEIGGRDNREVQKK